MVVDTCDPSTQETKAGDPEFEDSLDYILEACLKTKSIKNLTTILSFVTCSDHTVYGWENCRNWLDLFCHSKGLGCQQEREPRRIDLNKNMVGVISFYEDMGLRNEAVNVF